jgi:NAD(P)-dependent dehydrogenase (short-subunit alcohol dehydrogenase family)
MGEMRKRQTPRVLIVGGAGFIGVNAARRFQQDGWDVFVWDNLSRPGAEINLQWLQSFGPVHFSKIDIRDEKTVAGHFQRERYDMVLHCAGQVAVSASLANPRYDLENNVLGTFNLLEAVRLFQRGGGPIRAGLFQNLWIGHRLFPSILHLWAPPIRHGGSRLGRLVPDCPRPAPPHHHLWRRQTDS